MIDPQIMRTKEEDHPEQTGADQSARHALQGVFLQGEPAFKGGGGRA